MKCTAQSTDVHWLPWCFSYFHCSLIGYFLGLLTATVSSEVFKAAQPALLYLVPFTLLPLLTMAYLKVSQRLSNPQREYYNCPPRILLKFLGQQDSDMERYPNPELAAEIHSYCLKNSIQF